MKCYVCNKKCFATSKHHIKPRAEGGSDDERNLITLCPHHHDQLEGKSWVDINMARRAYRQGSRNTWQNRPTQEPNPPFDPPAGWGWTQRENGWYLWKKDKYGLTFKGPLHKRDATSDSIQG